MSAPYGVRDIAAYEENRRAAAEVAQSLGFNEETFVQVSVQWGDQDPNNHLNNAVYFKHLEAGRGAYIHTIVQHLPKRAANTIMGGRTGRGMVVGEVTNRFERPVFAPDYLLVAHRAKAVGEKKIVLESVIVSFAQRAKVCSGSATMVGYDYDALRGAALDESLVDYTRQEIAENEKRDRERAAKAKL